MRCQSAPRLAGPGARVRVGVRDGARGRAAAGRPHAARRHGLRPRGGPEPVTGRSGPESRAGVGRCLLGPLAATTGLLGVLLLWARTHEQSCLALAAPALIYLAVFWGLLEHRLERRRFAVHYYLDVGSPWRRLFRRWWLPAATSLLAAFPLAVLLSVFATLARATDWLFLAGAAVLAPLLFNRLAAWPGRHFRRTGGGALAGGPAAILTSRLAGNVLLGAVVLAYVHLNYSVIPGPPNVHGDPLTTGAAFAASVGSACPVVEAVLRTAALLLASALGNAELDLGGGWGEWSRSKTAPDFRGETERTWVSSIVIDWELSVAATAVVQANHSRVSCGVSYQDFYVTFHDDGTSTIKLLRADIQLLQTFDGLPQAFANCRRVVERQIGLE